MDFLLVKPSFLHTPEFTPMKHFMVRAGAKDLVTIQCGPRCGNTFFFKSPTVFIKAAI